MPRYKLVLEYDGQAYLGWQRQKDGPSIQAALMAAAEQLSGELADVVGAGRTDAGVHATGQVAHVDIPNITDSYKVMQGLNHHLFLLGHPDIAVLAAEAAPDDFHARFSASKRHYMYKIHNRRARLALEARRAWQVIETLDENVMQLAANKLLGTHDFTSFRDTECQAKSPEKTLDYLRVKRAGDYLEIKTGARSFLHHQVRIIVGTLVEIGKGRFPLAFIDQALAARDRASAGPTAPPDGLYLTQVDY